MDIKNAILMNKKMILLGLLGVLFISAAVYILKPRKQTEVGPGFLFHPDSVVRFDWNISNKNFVFTRPNRNVDWEPYVVPTLIQRKLNLLAVAKLKKMSTPKSQINLTVGFSDASSWHGVYGDQKFVWTSGMYAGKGFIVDDTYRPFFESGQWAFRELKYNWCLSRPKIIKFELDDKDYVVKFQDQRWLINSSEIDTTYFEKWLGRNCELIVDRFYDLSNFSVPKGQDLGDFEVVFDDGKDIDWDNENGYWEVSKDLAIESAGLTSALRELLTFLHIK